MTAIDTEALRLEIAALRAELKASRAPLGPVLSLEQTCELLGCKRRQVFVLLRKGRLDRAPRLGRLLRVTRESVERLLHPAPPKSRKQRAQAFEPARLEDIPVFG